MHSDAASGWAGLALAHPEFGISVHPIPTRGGADYTHHITACPSRFENLVASLIIAGRHVKLVFMANFENADAYYENINRELNSSSSLWCKDCSNFVIFFSA